jgi:hypothetical protein
MVGSRVRVAPEGGHLCSLPVRPRVSGGT